MINDIKSLCELMWNIEEKFDLLNFYIDGIPVWQCLRMKIYYELAEKAGVFTEAHRMPNDTKLKIEQTFNMVKNSIRDNAITIKNCKCDYIFFDHQRKVLVDGKYVDIYTDEILNQIDEDKVIVFESMYNRRHWGKKQKNRFYDDYIDIKTSLNKRLKKVEIPKEAKQVINKVEKYIEEVEKIQIDLQSIINDSLKMFPARMNYYIELFSKIQPKAIFIVVAYGKPEVVIAAKKLGIKVIEIQHGVAGRYHLGYSYPKCNRKLEVFPDKIISFGDYWFKNMDIPINEEDIIPYGFPYFNFQKKRYINIKKDPKQILFISQGVIGKRLGGIFKELAKILPDYKLVFKLHPGEVSDWKEKYTELVEASSYDNVIIEDGKKKHLYEYFAESTYVVGVFSTAMYEAISFECKGILVNLPGIEYMKDLIDSNLLIEVNDAYELRDAIKSDKAKIIPSNMFFYEDTNFSNILKLV